MVYGMGFMVANLDMLEVLVLDVLLGTLRRRAPPRLHGDRLRRRQRRCRGGADTGQTGGARFGSDKGQLPAFTATACAAVSAAAGRVDTRLRRGGARTRVREGGRGHGSEM